MLPENLDQRNFLPGLGAADKVIELHLEAAKEGGVHSIGQRNTI